MWEKRKDNIEWEKKQIEKALDEKMHPEKADRKRKQARKRKHNQANKQEHRLSLYN